METKNYKKNQENINKDGLVITFDSSTAVNVGGVIMNRKNISVYNFSDDVVNKTVSAFTNAGNFTLWKGNDYDAIGNWTNEQAINRLKELVLNNKKG